MIADFEEPIDADAPCVRVRSAPNASLAGRFETGVFVAIAAMVLLPAVALAQMGAWPMLPFAGAEILVLAWAFGVMRRRRGDFELVEIDGPEIRLDIRQDGRRESRTLNRHWAQLVVRREAKLGERVHVSVRSHGSETAIGRFMNDEDRLAMAAKLGKWIRTVRSAGVAR